MTDDSTVVCIHGFPTSSYDWIKVGIKSMHAGQFFMNFCRLLNLLKFNFFEKIFQENHLPCQTVWIQMSPIILSGLILFQSVCKGHQQMARAGSVLILLLFKALSL